MGFLTYHGYFAMLMGGWPSHFLWSNTGFDHGTFTSGIMSDFTQHNWEPTRMGNVKHQNRRMMWYGFSNNSVMSFKQRKTLTRNKYVSLFNLGVLHTSLPISRTTGWHSIEKTDPLKPNHPHNRTCNWVPTLSINIHAVGHFAKTLANRSPSSHTCRNGKDT
jgi:hypothetical protein